MPPTSRAASRLRSVPLENKPPTKSATNPRKRAASIAEDGEDAKAPPPRKRGRPAKNTPATDNERVKETVTQNLNGGVDKVAPRKRGRPPKSPRATADGTAKETVALNLARGSRTKAINELQQPASHPRPARLCFVFGTGDFGQFGLGTETLGEISRPRLHAWFAAAAKGDILGSQGAGVEKICAGGMHTLAVDEAGKVKSC
jgi:regulator of chromosome condensation